MTMPADDACSAPAETGITLDDLWREYGDQHDITVIEGGYRALVRDSGARTLATLYGRTPAELAESIRMAEGVTGTGRDLFTGRPRAAAGAGTAEAGGAGGF